MADGNEVGSHTDHHVPMLRVDEKGRSYIVEDDATYRQNVRSSYEKLFNTIGDMKIEGAAAMALRGSYVRQNWQSAVRAVPLH